MLDEVLAKQELVETAKARVTIFEAVKALKEDKSYQGHNVTYDFKFSLFVF